MLIAMSVLVVPHAASAGVGKVSSPEVEKGMVEFEYSGTRYHDSARGLNNKQSHTYELEYGFTDRFLFGLEAKSAREAGEGNTLTGVGAEAQYVLTTQGDWWLTSAIKGEYLIGTHNGEPDAGELNMLASYRSGNARLIGNVGIERSFGVNQDRNVLLSSALQASYRINPYINPGLEWHADHGPLGDFGQQRDTEYYAGPIARGELIAFGNSALGYTAGYYWGLNEGAASRAARVQLGYEFAF